MPPSSPLQTDTDHLDYAHPNGRKYYFLHFKRLWPSGGIYCFVMGNVRRVPRGHARRGLALPLSGDSSRLFGHLATQKLFVLASNHPPSAGES